MSRREKLRNELKNIVAILKRDYKPKKIILFGSFVNGKVNRWSDLDLVVIQDTNRRYIERLKEVALLTKPKIGVNFFVYTPAEFNLASKQPFSFIKNEVLNKGKILYEAS